MNKYYIAYSYKTKETIGFGDVTFENKHELKMNTLEDIISIKEYLSKLLKEKEQTIVEGITIMDFRELEK